MDNQKKIIKELREINKITRIEKPYRLTLLESDIPVNFKSAAMKRSVPFDIWSQDRANIIKSKTGLIPLCEFL